MKMFGGYNIITISTRSWLQAGLGSYIYSVNSEYHYCAGNDICGNSSHYNYHGQMTDSYCLSLIQTVLVSDPDWSSQLVQQ